MERSERFPPKVNLKNALLLSAALTGCHPDVRIRDTSVEFALLRVVQSCESVRANALRVTSSPNSILQSTENGQVVHESCQCAGGECEYVKGKRVESQCETGPCTQYNITAGLLRRFDAGDDGIQSTFEFLLIPTPSIRGETPRTESKISSLISGRDAFHAGTCSFSTSHFDPAVMKKPRVDSSVLIEDCLGIDGQIEDSLSRLLRQGGENRR